jgi:hypothetical protein
MLEALLDYDTNTVKTQIMAIECFIAIINANTQRNLKKRIIRNIIIYYNSFIHSTHNQEIIRIALKCIIFFMEKHSIFSLVYSDYELGKAFRIFYKKLKELQTYPDSQTYEHETVSSKASKLRYLISNQRRKFRWQVKSKE